MFNLLIEDYARCEECLKECISIDQNELTGFILWFMEIFEKKKLILFKCVDQINIAEHCVRHAR